MDYNWTVSSNAIMASDLVLSPMRLGGFELAALTRLQEQLYDLRRIRPDIKLMIFGTMFQNQCFVPRGRMSDA